MMLSTKLLEAAGNAATTPVYVEDVFSTYLYTGNGSSQVIENGIALGDNALATASNTTASSIRSGSAYEQFFSTTGNYGVFAGYSAGEYLRVDFGAPTSVSSVTYKNAVSSPWAPTSVLVQYSSDNVSWATAATYSDDGGTAIQTISVAAGTGRYWRLYQNSSTRASSSGYEWHFSHFSMVGTSAGVGKGGLVWTKNRVSTYNNVLIDTARGASNFLMSDQTSGQLSNSTFVTSFNANGYALGSGGGVNASGEKNVSWTFRKQPKFFDVVTYTGNGTTTQTINHSLGCQPGFILLKATSSSGSWFVLARSDATNYKYLFLNSANGSGGTYAQTSCASDTQINLGYIANNIDSFFNLNGTQYVAYLFAHNAGGFGLNGTDNVISCGMFTTDSSGNATVNLGYEPQWILTKQSNATNSWGIYDTMRSWSHGEQRYLLPDMSMAEGAINATNFVPTATGFTTSSPYATSAPYIYIAIRKGPMRVPTDATTVFKPVYATTPSSPYTVTTNFPVDLNISAITNGTYNRAVVDRLRGMNSANQNRYIVTHSDSAESSSLAGYYLSFQSNTSITDTQFWTGYSLSPVYWNFRRAPSFFDQVCYTGTGAALTLNHNLGVAPELIITKSRSQGSGYNWNTWCTGLTNNQYLNLNLASSVQTYSGIFGGSSTVATATTFNVSNSATANNDSGQTFVAYLFATCAGVSKVGSYTGTGSSQTINCGFTGGARFVLIKCTSQAYDWMVFDTARGITSTSDPFLVLNSNVAQNTISSGATYNLSFIDSHATGFTLPNNYGFVNASGENYIYLAIA